MARKTAATTTRPAPAGMRMPLRLGELRPVVDLWIERFAAAHGSPQMSLHAAVLTLIRRGLQASAE